MADTRDILTQYVRIEPLTSLPGVTEREIRSRLLTFQYEDTTDKPPKVEITLSNDDMFFLQPLTLPLGMDLRVSWGYLSGRAVRDVTVRRVGGVSRGNKPTEIALSGRPTQIDRAHRTTGQLSRLLPRFDNISISKAVEEIARILGFQETSWIIEDTHANLDSLVVPDSWTPAEFLEKMARYTGFIWDIRSAGERTVFHFHSRGYAAAVAPIALVGFGGPDVLEWGFDNDMTLPAPSKAQARGVDPRSRLTVSSFGADLGSLTVNDWPSTGPFESNEDGTAPADGATQTDAQRNLYTTATIPTSDAANKAFTRATRAVASRAYRQWKLRMRLIGNPDIMAKRDLRLDGFGTPFVDGVWWVRGVRHTVDTKGYLTEILEASRVAPGTGTGSCTPSFTATTVTGRLGGTATTCEAPRTARRRRRRRDQ